MAGQLLPGTGRKFSYRKPPMHEINVTPFVDVMLVLLIVFMISAPLMTQAIKVDLPETVSPPITNTAEPIEVSIKRNGEIYIQAQQVPQNRLAARLKAIQKVRTDAPIVLRADKNVAYGRVMSVMSSLQAAGLVDINLETQPLGRGR